MPKPGFIYDNRNIKTSVKQQNKTKALQRHVNYDYRVLIELHHVNQIELKNHQQIYLGRKSFTVFMLKFIDTKNITHATSEPIIDAWYGSTKRS